MDQPIGMVPEQPRTWVDDEWGQPQPGRKIRLFDCVCQSGDAGRKAGAEIEPIADPSFEAVIDLDHLQREVRLRLNERLEVGAYVRIGNGANKIFV